MLMRGYDRSWRCNGNSWPVTGDRLQKTGIDAVILDIITIVLVAGEEIRLTVWPDSGGADKGAKWERQPAPVRQDWLRVALVLPVFSDIVPDVASETEAGSGQ